MFGSRRNRSSLIGTAARTAVVVKTANAVSGNNRAAPAAAVAPATSAPVTAVAPVQHGISSDDLARLQQLADMHKAGILTDEEFATQKARILA
jgi:hypothetical protein